MNFQLDKAIGMHVNRTAFLMTEEIAKRFSAHGYQLSAQDFGILFRLSQQPTMTQVDIAALMMRDKTTITRRIDSLVKKQLVERNPDPNDRRYYRISLTPSGKQALKLLAPMVSGFQQALLRDIPDAEKEITINTLKHITERLIQYKTTGNSS
ncbi:MAG: MarR family transcriptional regulator [Mariprofundaceae bacterium]|nr:MarR family transcriptional regulator [Mariprofundaceae bacterium]